MAALKEYFKSPMGVTGLLMLLLVKIHDVAVFIKDDEPVAGSAKVQCTNELVCHGLSSLE